MISIPPTLLPFGLHVQGGGLDKVKFFNHVLKARYGTYTIMNDFGLACDLVELFPGALVVYRDSDWEPYPEGGVETQLDAVLKKNQDTLNSRSSAREVYLMVNCETAGFNPLWLGFHSRMMEAAEKRGIKLCVGNWASGSIKTGWEDGERNPWLGAKDFLNAVRAGGHLLGMHEYTSGYAWFVSEGMPADEAHAGFEHALTSLDFDRPNWHIGRVSSIHEACRELGIEPPTILITEGFIDRMNDVIDRFPANATLRGWRTWVSRWVKWYIGITPGKVLAKQLFWVSDKVYRPLKNVYGPHVYTWSDENSPDDPNEPPPRKPGERVTPNWWDFRVDYDLDFQREVEAEADRRLPAQPIPTPTPTPDPDPAPVYDWRGRLDERELGVVAGSIRYAEQPWAAPGSNLMMLVAKLASLLDENVKTRS